MPSDPAGGPANRISDRFKVALSGGPEVALDDPVAETRLVSHDTTLTHRLTLADGRTMTALEIQQLYLEVIAEALGDEVDPETRDVLDRWQAVLAGLASEPMGCAAQVEWVAKLQLLEGMRQRDGAGWDDPRLAALDLQWSDLRPERSIYQRLLAAGRVETLTDPQDVARAVTDPPADTRAWFRGEVIRRYGAAVTAAGWESVVLDLPGEEHLVHLPMREPARGTRADLAELLDASPDATTLLDRLRHRRD